MQRFIYAGTVWQNAGGFEERRLNILAFDFAALFTASEIAIEAGQSVEFANWSVGGSDYHWNFEGGTPAVSSEYEPVVTYETAGEYTVSLSITSTSGKESKLELEKHIIVSAVYVLGVSQEIELLIFQFLSTMS